MLSNEIVASRIYLACGFVALYAIAHASASSPVPTIFSPYPAAQLFIITFGVSRLLGFLALPLLFVMFNVVATIRPYRGRFAYLAVLGVLLMIANVVYILLRASAGQAKQGPSYVVGTIMINILLLVLFWVTWAAWRSNSATSVRAVILGFALFVWLTWYAFPFFGEVI